MNWARRPGADTVFPGWPVCGPAWATPRPPCKYLDIYQKAFILRNGFHANGDQLKAGYSEFHLSALHAGGQLFGVPSGARDVAAKLGRRDPRLSGHARSLAPGGLRRLAGEGGYRVSARRQNNVTTWLKVTASREGGVKIRDNFAGRQPTWTRPGVEKVGDNWQSTSRPGRRSKPGCLRVEWEPRPVSQPRPIAAYAARWLPTA